MLVLEDHNNKELGKAKENEQTTAKLAKFDYLLKTLKNSLILPVSKGDFLKKLIRNIIELSVYFLRNDSWYKIANVAESSLRFKLSEQLLIGTITNTTRPHSVA